VIGRAVAAFVAASIAVALGVAGARLEPTDATPADRGSPPAEGEPPVLGMTITCRTWGWEWGSDEMATTIGEVASLGVNWIAIHPYAGIGRDGAVGTRRGLDIEDPPARLLRPVTEARARDVRVVYKPHLAYWGSGFAWRGEIEFGEDEPAWRRFFDDYERWIVDLAVIADRAGADAFVVGTELDRTIHREAEWRRIIAAVREHFDGPLTYAANWTDYERVPFWDALDVVGIQAYFPLAEASDGDPAPDRAALDRAWARRMVELRDFANRTNRDVVFTELGYTRSVRAAIEPWRADRIGDPETARTLQAACLAAALDAIAAEPTVRGAFLWKWFARPRPTTDFAMSDPVIREVIRAAWGARSERDGPPSSRADGRGTVGPSG